MRKIYFIDGAKKTIKQGLFIQNNETHVIIEYKGKAKSIPLEFTSHNRYDLQCVILETAFNEFNDFKIKQPNEETIYITSRFDEWFFNMGSNDLKLYHVHKFKTCQGNYHLQGKFNNAYEIFQYIKEHDQFKGVQLTGIVSNLAL